MLRGVNVSGASKLPYLITTTTKTEDTTTSVTKANNASLGEDQQYGSIHVDEKILEDGRKQIKTTERKVLYTHIKEGFLTEEPPTKLLGVDPSYDASKLEDVKGNVKEDCKLSFVGRPFPLSEADEHFGRLRRWGFNFLRWNVAWEALEHEGP
jgi:hypothetical protein